MAVDHRDRDWDDDDDEKEFDLGIPETFDPGYNADPRDLPRVCMDCGRTFFLWEDDRKERKEESCFDDLCMTCVGKLIDRWAEEADEIQQIAKRLGMSLEQFCGWD